MKEVKKLCWSPSKTYRHDGELFHMHVQVMLADECRNGHYDFSITGDISRKAGNGRWVDYAGGCIHEEIVERFPELEKFVPLHLSNYLGHPMYAVANGQYWISMEEKNVAKRELRITDEELEKLSLVCEKEDRQYFKYLLYSLGIVDRWKREADEFIAFIQEKAGVVWVNPYKPEEERNVMCLTDEERKEIEQKITEGYYTEEAIRERSAQRVRDKIQKQRDEIIKEYEKQEKKASGERDVKLYLLDCGIPLDNVIYYNHTNRVVFNWQNYGKKISKEVFDDFVSKVDYSQLPDGITFSLGK